MATSRPGAQPAATSGVRVAKSSIIDGRGVFACQAFDEGDFIEACPVIVLGPQDRLVIDQTELVNYYFGWKGDSAALALGYGSMYNHSFTPNAKYVRDEVRSKIEFYAIRPISAGDEVFFNYNGDPDGQTPVWFDAV